MMGGSVTYLKAKYLTVNTRFFVLSLWMALVVMLDITNRVEGRVR